MTKPLDILILRDPRESVKKCSLTPLRGQPGVRFVGYDAERQLDPGGRILLHPDGELLSQSDAGCGLFLIDCSWRRLPKLLKTVQGSPPLRRLPVLQTAYPRRSQIFDDPEQGLASIEALYAALALMGELQPSLLTSYRWAQEFLSLNPSLSRSAVE